VKAALLILCLAPAPRAETRLKTDWFVAYNGAGFTGVEARAAALGPDGTLFTGGSFGHPGWIPDYYIEARGRDDELLWSVKTQAEALFPNGQFTRGLAADRFGNLYAAGTAVTGSSGRDIFVQKRNQADGTLLWTRGVDGPARGDDEGYGIALDSAGVVAAGAVRSVGRGMDAWVGRFDPAGNRLWTQTLDGGGRGDDAAYGVCVDTYGRSYAVGAFFVAGAGLQIWVAKFGPDGTLLAQDLYGGSGNDRATGCSAGTDDTLFVSGAVEDPAAPSTQPVRTHSWLRAYGIRGASELRELATVVDEDNWGAANAAAAARLATGLQAVFTVGQIQVATTTNVQITRWIFDKGSSGWRNKREVFYDGPVHLDDAGFAACVDSEGNLVASGFETATDPQGTSARVAWYRKYDPWLLKESLDDYRSKAAADGTDQFNALYLDSYNELLYAAGTEYSAADNYEAELQVFDAGSGNRLDFWKSGLPHWEIPSALQRDSAGNFYLAGSYSYSLWKIERQSNGKFGTMDWYSTYNPAPGTHGGNAFGAALMPDGTLFTVGHNTRLGSYYDIFAAKWDVHSCDHASAGSFCRPAILWQEFVTSPGETTDTGLGAAADGQGNAYAIGTVNNAATSNDIWIAKYSPGGNRLWTDTLDGPSHGADIGRAIAFNPSNNKLYAAGYRYAAGQGSNFWLAQVDKEDGRIVWETEWNGPANYFDYATCMTFDADGSVFLGGHSYKKNSKGNWALSGALVKFDPDGMLLDAQTFELPGAIGVSVNSIQVDGRGKVYAAGHMSVPERTSSDAWAARFSFEAVTPPPAAPPGPPCALYAYPNPFHPDIKRAVLHWDLPEDAAVSLGLFDQLGRRVASWDFPSGAPGGRKGINETVWDGSNSSGGKAVQGMYYLRMDARPVDCKRTARIGLKR
jgi:hypothetical protein